MPVFSKHSLDKLSDCDPRLIEICKEAIKIVDFVVCVGFRNKEDQEEAVRKGNSKVHWPNSKHNKIPSKAVDLAPYYNGEIAWKDLQAFCVLAGVIKAIASMKGFNIRWGGDFNGNWNMTDDKWDDLPHFEIQESSL